MTTLFSSLLGRSLCLLIALTAPALDCASRPETAPSPQSPADTTQAPYDFGMPDAAFALPGVLHEISGLTLLPDNQLGAVQDEEGDLFIIDIATGTVTDQRRFRGDDDYEGVEYARGKVYILRSDGTLFELDKWQDEDDDDLDADKHGTPLNSSCDAEGLAYDDDRGALLILCKENPGKRYRGTRAIFAFDLDDKDLIEEPAYTVSLAEVRQKSPPDHPLNERLRTLTAPFANLNAFKPAALARHPMTKELYMVSSVSKVMAVLSPEGDLVAVHALPVLLFPQPEGLAFLPNGDLFVANEGGGQGALLRFNYRP